MPSVGKKESKILHAIARKKMKDFKDSAIVVQAKTEIEQIKPGPLARYTTEEELTTAIAEYFNGIVEAKTHPTLTGLALKLGIDRQTLLSYKEKDMFAPAINKAKAIILEYTEQMLIGKNTFTPGLIFYLKNNYKQDYADKIEVEHSGSVSLVELNKRAMMLEDCEIIEAEAISPPAEAQAEAE